MVIGLLYKFFENGIHDWKGILPGCVLLLFSLMWKNHIGSGDGIIVMAVGWMCGLSMVCDVLVGGFLLAACAGILCWIQGKRKNVELPFVPFFFGSYLLELWVQRSGI